MGGLNIKNLKFSFDKSKSLIGKCFLKMTSPSLLTKISNGSTSHISPCFCCLQDRSGRAGDTMNEWRIGTGILSAISR